MAHFQQAYRRWVGEALAGEMAVRDDRWSDAIAVGSLAFVDKVKVELGLKAMHREVADIGGTYILREPREAYARDFSTESDALRLDNSVPWGENREIAVT